MTTSIIILKKIIPLFILLSIFIIIIIFSKKEEKTNNLNQSELVTEDGTDKLGLKGIRVEIPSGALITPQKIAINIVQDLLPNMKKGVNILGEVYDIVGFDGKFEKPINIILEFDRSKIPENAEVYACFWKENRWVQVAGEISENTIIVKTDHLSKWTVLYFDILEWSRNNIPILGFIYDVSEVIFGFERDIWNQTQSDRIAIDNNVDEYLGDNRPIYETKFIEGEAVDKVIVGEKTYSLIPTNYARLEGINSYSETEKQLGVIDEENVFVEDEEILFKVLFTYECRQFLNKLELNKLSELLEEAAAVLIKSHFWHAAASFIDIVQSLLSEVLTHSTGVPYEPTELLREDYLLALEGTVCRAEVERYARDVMELSEKLKNIAPDQLNYLELSEVYTLLINFFSRKDPIMELQRETFPSYDENWFTYTIKKVFNDFLDLILKKEATSFTHKALDLRVSNNNAEYLAMLATIYEFSSNTQKLKGMFDLIVYALNVQGNNPLVQYYKRTKSINSSGYISRLKILAIICYLNNKKFAQTIEYSIRNFVWMNKPREWSASVLMPDGKIFVTGGLPGSGNSGAGRSQISTEMYDPINNTWTLKANLNQARGVHKAVLLNDGRVLVIGGQSSSVSGMQHYNTGEVYNPSSNRFVLLSSRMSEQRVSPIAVLLNDGRVLIAGGENRNGTSRTADIFDPKTNSFKPVGNMSVGRAYFTGTLLESGKILVVGGKSADLFDPITETFSFIGNTNAKRGNHTATKLIGGKVLIAGGNNNSAEIFDPSTNSFNILSNTMTVKRNRHTATLLNDGRVVLIGGLPGTLKSAEIFNPVDKTFTLIGSLNEGRFDHESFKLHNRKVLVIGGAYDPRGSGSIALRSCEMIITK